MTVQDEVRSIPIRRDIQRFRESRLPLKELQDSPERLLKFRYPNGVAGWLVTHAEDFRAILGDPRFHAKRFLGEPQPVPVSIEVPDMPGFIPSMNGPEHLRVRRLAAADFSVKHINDLRPLITEIVDKHLDEFQAQGSPADLYAQYALPIPSEVIASILGIPHTHTADFQNAAKLTIGGRSEALSDPEAPARAIKRLHEIIGEVAEMKRANPTDDLISRLILAGDPPLTTVEIQGLCTNLLLAGHETTATGSAVSLAILLERPDQLKLFQDNPDRLPESIEELNRFRTLLADSGSGIPRLATEDVEYKGQLIRKGDWVMLSTGLANFDPAVSPHDPQTLDLTRDPGRGNLTFGFGAHTCLGQHLARAEMQIIMSRLFQRFPNLKLVMPVDEMPWMDKGFGYRMAELMVSW
jgi:cytochrome P450